MGSEPFVSLLSCSKLPRVTVFKSFETSNCSSLSEAEVEIDATPEVEEEMETGETGPSSEAEETEVPFFPQAVSKASEIIKPIDNTLFFINLYSVNHIRVYIHNPK